MFSTIFGAQHVPRYSPSQGMQSTPPRKTHKHQVVVSRYVTPLSLLLIFICNHLFHFYQLSFGECLFKLET